MIHLLTPEGSVSYDPDTGEWTGDLARVVEEFPAGPRWFAPVGPMIPEDHTDPRWLLLHAEAALDDAGILIVEETVDDPIEPIESEPGVVY